MAKKKLKIGQKNYYGECLNTKEHLNTVIALISLTDYQKEVLHQAIAEVVRAHLKENKEYFK